MELVEGQSWIGEKQWELDLGLLGHIPAQSLRRLQFCVIFGDEHCICDDAIAQVKRIRWATIRQAFGRFASLEQIAIITKGADEWMGDHIWQEIELQLRALGSNRLPTVVRRSFCIV